MTFSRLCTLIGVGGMLLMLTADVAEAQRLRRLIRSLAQPPATAEQAPTAEEEVPPSRGWYLGRRRRILAQQQAAQQEQQQAAQQRGEAQQQANTNRQQAGVRQASAQIARKQPTLADVDRLAYPAASELAVMDNDTLVETLRDMMTRLDYRLSLLETGKGWQRYLVLGREHIGPPGGPLESASLSVIQEVLPRYGSVQKDARFVRIATLPSFVATYNSLQEVKGRLLGSVQLDGPTIVDPNGGQAIPTQKHVEAPIEQIQEVLPTPTPAVLPNATRGERSILKRK